MEDNILDVEMLDTDTIVEIEETPSVEENDNVYKNGPFSVIIYDSSNFDSLLSKEIILAQYKYAYSKDIEIKENNIVSFDTTESVLSNEEIDLSKLDKTPPDRIFICGLNNLNTDLLNKFISDGETVHVFESNVYLISQYRYIFTSHTNVKNHADKSMSISLKVLKTLIDPLEVFNDSDNKAYEVLHDYSLVKTLTYNIHSDKNYDEIKYNVEHDLNIENFLKVLLNRTDQDLELFNNTDTFENYEADAIEKFRESMNNYGLLWTGNTLAINDRIDVPRSEVERLIAEEKKYALIFTYSQDTEDFFTGNIYRAERPYIGVDDNDPCTPEEMEENRVYYLESGLGVVKKILNKDKSNERSVWYNYSSNKMIDDIYETIRVINKERYPNTYPGDEEVKELDRNDEFFRHVYLNRSQIEFNVFDLYKRACMKFTCIGNKDKVTAYITPKQLYDCVYQKFLF